MKTKTLLLILLSILFLKRDIIAQSSYQISIDSSEIVPQFLIENSNKDLSGIFFQSRSRLTDNFIYADLLINENKAIGHKIKIPGKSFNIGALNSKIIDDRAYLLTRGGNFDSYIFGSTGNGSNFWVRKEPNSPSCSLTGDNQQIILLSWTFGAAQLFGITLHFLSPDTGETLANRKWVLKKETNNLHTTANQVDIIGNNVVLNGIFFDSGVHYAFLALSDNFGNPINKIAFKGYQIEKLEISPNDEIYLLGKTVPTANSQENAVIMKFDANLNHIWSKVFYADNFEYEHTSMSFSATGSPILAYSTEGPYPTILVHLDLNGEILSEVGYALFSPTTKVLEDGSLLLLTDRHFNKDGDVFFKNIIAKTDKEGTISGCENYPARLFSYDVQPEFEAFGIIPNPASELEWATAVTEPCEFTFSDFCDLPPAPNPDFISLDTICLGECLRTDSTLSNRNAQANEWTLEGENMQPFISDSTEFEYCFDTIGTYTLRQTIWFLGIDYSFEKIIEVLPSLEIEIQPDSIICESPALLTLNSNRPLQNVEWSTGATEPEVYSFDSGIHSVIADDGFCHASDTSFLEFIFEKIDTNLTLDLPDSMTVCDINLPFELKPKSEYSTTFLDENSKLDSLFLLSKTGEYFFSTEVLGCRFSKKIDFKTDACKAEIFTPSAFSPNNDGINDEFIPLGKNIEPIRLEIYDRWGGKVFVSNDSQMAWDGSFDGKPVSKGVYVFRFEYLNLLSGLEEEISGDVSVLK